jgi:lipopolysaccharide transport system ATP-binding protein
MSGKSSEGEILEEDILYEQSYQWAKFKAIRTVSKRGVSNSFGINEEIKVELEYEVLKDGEIIQPSVHVLDNLGNCILATFNGKSANSTIDPLFNKPLEKGIYKAVCTIPAFFLNDITYLISCFLVPNNITEMAITREVLNLSINETGEMRKEFTGTWIGLIRPKLNWISSKLS